MAEIIITIAMIVGGAILERETNGAVTINIGYSDNNISKCK